MEHKSKYNLVGLIFAAHAKDLELNLAQVNLNVEHVEVQDFKQLGKVLS